jgi:hypothetical protein
MAAKQKSARRKGRKPKLIDIEGHQLTPAMYADYQRYIESRKTTNAGYTVQQIEDLALSDFLSGYRPSIKIKRQVIVLSCMASRTTVAIGEMRDYSFYAGEPAAIRSAGCKLLRDLAKELSNSAGVLMAMADGVEAEKEMKIQDWLAQAVALEQLGCSKEFAHGNC